MNINTREIIDVVPGEPMPKGFQPIEKRPTHNCPQCHGKGRTLVKAPGKRGKICYALCHCVM